MPRRRHQPLPPVPTWTCPHCGHVHRPADIRRVDFDHLRCQSCGQIFDSKPDTLDVVKTMWPCATDSEFIQTTVVENPLAIFVTQESTVLCDCDENFKRKYYGQIQLWNNIQGGFPSGSALPPLVCARLGLRPLKSF